jgi:hypothetical protein
MLRTRRARSKGAPRNAEMAGKAFKKEGEMQEQLKNGCVATQK